MTEEKLVQLLRDFADLVEAKAPKTLSNPPTESAVAYAEKVIAEADRVPEADDIKTELSIAGKKHGTPTVRQMIIDTIGQFKPTAKMTPDERLSVHNALKAL